jgi:butanol dehydrogenase
MTSWLNEVIHRIVLSGGHHMRDFIYQNTTRIYFGQDQLKHLAEELRKHGSKVLITYGGGSIRRSGLFDRVVKQLNQAGITYLEFGGIEPNPRVESVNAAAQLCKQEGIDIILAVGGGSVIDASKVIAAANFYDGDAWDLVVRKASITQALPLISILTLSATGTEMNTNAVISKLSEQAKIGLSHPTMLPKASFLDPSNTFSVDKYQTACGSADIMSHLIEQYFTLEPGMEMMDEMMESIMRTVIKYTPVALDHPDNYEARANLMWASTWALNGFVRVGKSTAWSCHPMEHQISAVYDITHGLGLAILTPRWLQHVLDETTVSRYVRFGTKVFDIDASLPEFEIAKLSIQALADFFFKTSGLTSTLTELNIDETHFVSMAQKACNNTQIPGFKTLGVDDVIAIFKACL